MNDLIMNATIFYKNGFRRICDVISITEKGVYTGFIKSFEKKDVFVNSSFIPIDQIRKIIVFKRNGRFRNINY
jgi:hypothetical protein